MNMYRPSVLRGVLLATLACLVHAASVSAQSIMVTSPAGGDVWTRGGSYAIRWTSTGSVPGVRIQLMQGTSSTAVDEIVLNTEDDGTHWWDIPAAGVVGDNFRIRVSSTASYAVYDYSDYFALSSGVVNRPVVALEIVNIRSTEADAKITIIDDGGEPCQIREQWGPIGGTWVAGPSDWLGSFRTGQTITVHDFWIDAGLEHYFRTLKGSCRDSYHF